MNIQEIKDFVIKILSRIGIRKDAGLMLNEPAILEEENKREKFVDDLQKDTTQDTVLLIPIQVIQDIITKQEVFEEFMKAEDGSEILQNVPKSQYINCVRQYYEAIKSMGYKVTKEQFERISNINKLEENASEIVYSNRINPLAIPIETLTNILGDEETFNKFLNFKENRKLFGIASKEEYILQLNKMFKTLENANIDLGKEAVSHMNCINEDKNINNYGYKFNPSTEVSKDFEEAVMRDIPKDLSQIALAKAIYIELNKRVEFDPTFMARSQDLNIDFIRRIYEKPINEITLENNKIVCKTWAELYTYLLNKNGISAVVSGNGKHKYTTLLADDTIITAEATNVKDGKDKTKMNDITRAKLGLAMEGFEGKNRDISKETEEVEAYLLYGEEKQSLKEKIEVLKDSMDFDKDIIEKTFNIKLEGNMAAILESMGIMKELVESANLGMAETLTYFNQLMHLMLSSEERAFIKKSYVSEKISETEASFAEVIALGNDNIGYKYLRIDSEQGLRAISEKQLVQDLRQRKLFFVEPARENGESPIAKMLIDKILGGTEIENEHK